MSPNAQSMNAAIAVTRFGLGARPGEIAQAAGDPQGWLIAQIRPQGADVFPGRSAQEAGAAMAQYREGVRVLRAEMKAAPAAPPTLKPVSGPGPASPSPMQASPGMAETAPVDALQMRQRALYQPINQVTQGELLARAQLACTTPASFRERWALFWSNHFSTSAKNTDMRVLTPVFEREAIRPNVFGRFETLLAAASTHPGMLAYLDQRQSVGPNSPQVVRASMRRGQPLTAGLNENLAREILELHTVGADGGYTQADVTEFARALTGYGVSQGQAADGAAVVGSAVFREGRHEPGLRHVMGRSFPQEGAAQAHAILADLARRPQTIHRLCAKLAAHFVSDAPNPALTGRLEAAWRRSDGDLAQVAQALVRAPEAWAPPATKLKTPYELLISSYRAIGAAPRNAPRELFSPLTTLGQRPFEAPQPNGWPDTAAAWAAPDALVKRLTWAQGFASAYAPAGGMAGDMAAFATDALGARLTPAAALAIARAESRPEALAVLIMSPEFQRR